MKISTLIAGLNALCVQYTAHLNEAFWARAKARMEEIFSAESSFEERREAIAGGVKRAFSPDHWRFVTECIGTNFLLLGRGAQEEFFAKCDPDVLEVFVANEGEGLVSTTLLAIATTDALKPEHIALMHMALNGLNALAKGQVDWAEPRRNVAEVFEGLCTLLEGVPEHLQKRFDAILGSGDDEPKPEVRKASPPTVPARQLKSTPSAKPNGNGKPKQYQAEAAKPVYQPKVHLDSEAQAKADDVRGSATHQPFAGLAKIIAEPPAASVN